MNHITTTEEQVILHPDQWDLTGVVVTVGLMYEDWEYYDGLCCLAWWILGVTNPYRYQN